MPADRPDGLSWVSRRPDGALIFRYRLGQLSGSAVLVDGELHIGFPMKDEEAGAHGTASRPATAEEEAVIRPAAYAYLMAHPELQPQPKEYTGIWGLRKDKLDVVRFFFKIDGIAGGASFYQDRFSIGVNNVSNGARIRSGRPATPDEDVILRPALLEHARGLGDDKAELKAAILAQLEAKP